MNYFSMNESETIEALKTSREKGLTSEQAEESRRIHGENVIAEEKQKSVFRVFLEQFADLMVLLLIAASIISIFTDNVESAVVILAVITMNAVLGTLQHVKAQKSLASLKAMSSPSARVIRNGIQTEIPASEVVVGDILLIEAGNVAAADGRLLEAASLQVNESALTGESLNVIKSTEKINAEKPALGDRVNMIYSGSCVTNGRAVAAVTAVGMNTEIGKDRFPNAVRKKESYSSSGKSGQVQQGSDLSYYRCLCYCFSFVQIRQRRIYRRRSNVRYCSCCCRNTGGPQFYYHYLSCCWNSENVQAECYYQRSQGG